MKEEELIKRLKKRNLKVTAHRLQLLEEIDRYSGAMPYTQLQSNLQEMDRVTLYRTINALLEKGLIHKASAHEQENYYALCEDSCEAQAHNHQHIHFKCEHCKKIYCLPLSSQLNLETGSFKVHSFEVLATGICESCVSKT